MKLIHNLNSEITLLKSLSYLPEEMSWKRYFVNIQTRYNIA